MDRRSFLLAAGCSRTAETGATEMTRTAPLGIQLYSVRDLMAADVAATLELIASKGYREVEFAGYCNHSPADLKAMLSAVGLQAPSAHLPYSAFIESPEKVLEHATAMRHQFVVVPGLDTDLRSLEHYREHAENFNRWGELCKGAGIQLTYQNHQFEFEKPNARCLLTCCWLKRIRHWCSSNSISPGHVRPTLIQWPISKRGRDDSRCCISRTLIPAATRRISVTATSRLHRYSNISIPRGSNTALSRATIRKTSTIRCSTISTRSSRFGHCIWVQKLRTTQQ
jgi:hypothetical protein